MSEQDIASGEAGTDGAQHSNELALPVEQIHGVGEKYGARLRAVGIDTIGELADKTADKLATATRNKVRTEGLDGAVPEGVANNIIQEAQLRAMMAGKAFERDWDVESWAKNVQKSRVAVVWPDHYNRRDDTDVMGKLARAVLECPWEPEELLLCSRRGAAAGIDQYVRQRAMGDEPISTVRYDVRWNDIPLDAETTAIGVSTGWDAPEFVTRPELQSDQEILDTLARNELIPELTVEEFEDEYDSWKALLEAHDVSSDWWTVRNTRSLEDLFRVLDGVPGMTEEQFHNSFETWGEFLEEYDLEIGPDEADLHNLYYRFAARRRDEEMLDKATGVIILDDDENTEYTVSTANRMSKEVFQFKDGRRSPTISGSERTANSDEAFDATEDTEQETVDWSAFNDYDDDLDDGPGGDGDPTSGKKGYTSGQ